MRIPHGSPRSFWSQWSPTASPQTAAVTYDHRNGDEQKTTMPQQAQAPILPAATGEISLLQTNSHNART